MPSAVSMLTTSPSTGGCSGSRVARRGCPPVPARRGRSLVLHPDRHRPGPGRHPLHDVQQPDPGALRRGHADPLAPIDIPNSNAVAGDMAVDGDDIWFTDFNNDSLWRYNITDRAVHGVPRRAEPAADVVVDSAGDAWFTAPLDNSDQPARPRDRRRRDVPGPGRAQPAGASPSPPTGRSGSPRGSLPRASAASTRPPAW